MKPANFPARKAARQRSAAERRIPQIVAKLNSTSTAAHHQALKAELAILDIHNAMLVSPQRDVRSKKRRVSRSF